MRYSVVAALLCAAAVCLAQQPPAPSQPKVATVTFTRDWPQVAPQHYAISVDETCAAAYESSTDWPTLPGADDRGSVKFTMSPKNCKRVFALAEKLNFFSGQYDYHPGKIANTGTKTLKFVDAGHNSQTSFNYAIDPHVQEITKIFSDAAETIQLGAKIARDYHFDKLGLDADLHILEGNSRANSLAEVQVIAPVLQQVASDPRVVIMARRRAQAVLDRFGLPTQAKAGP
jgi:hypothetical protein